jgi:uncharacterized protein YkwD
MVKSITLYSSPNGQVALLPGRSFCKKSKPGACLRYNTINRFTGGIMFRTACLTLILLHSTLSLPSADSWSHDDYKETTYKTFRDNSLFSQEINFDAIDYPLLHAAILFVTNEKRVAKGLKPLTFAIELERAAYNHSKNMVLSGFFSHTDPYNSTRSSTDKRAKLAGITNPYIAENIAQTFGIQYKSGSMVYTIDKNKGLFSYTSGGPVIPPHTYLSFGEAVVTQWMNSPGHRANILSTNAISIGCGAYFFRDTSFNNIAKFSATQNFQWFKEIVPGEYSDTAPGEEQAGTD